MLRLATAHHHVTKVSFYNTSWHTLRVMYKEARIGDVQAWQPRTRALRLRQLVKLADGKFKDALDRPFDNRLEVTLVNAIPPRSPSSPPSLAEWQQLAQRHTVNFFRSSMPSYVRGVSNVVVEEHVLDDGRKLATLSFSNMTTIRAFKHHIVENFCGAVAAAHSMRTFSAKNTSTNARRRFCDLLAYGGLCNGSTSDFVGRVGA